MSELHHAHKGYWTTDDGSLRFDFSLHLGEEETFHHVHIQLCTTRLRVNVRNPLWETTIRVLGEKVHLNAPWGGGVISGHLRCEFRRTGPEGHYIIYAHIQITDPQLVMEFIGPMYVLKLGGGPPIIPYIPLPPPEPPVPVPIPVEALAEPEGLPIMGEGRHHDLFPYLYMRSWPEPEAEEVDLNFITYTPAVVNPPTASFYTVLCQFRKNGDTAGLATAAAQFMTGAVAYAEVFIPNLQQLPGALSSLNEAVLLSLKDHRDSEFLPLLILLTGLSDEELFAYAASAPCQQVMQDVWCSYFALMAFAGYRTELLNELSRVLIGCHALQQLGANSESSIHKLVRATVLLPADLFPMEKWIQPSAVRPYAIGNLQLVRQQLLRYEPGEIASITNVMPGERKTLVKRNRQRLERKEEEQSERTTQQNEETKTGEETMEKEIQKTLAGYTDTYTYQNLQSTYSSPTVVTIDGTFTMQKGSITPESSDSTSFARKVLGKTTNRLSETVSRTRSYTIRNEWEEGERSQFDNSKGKSMLTGVYRWLNKVYKNEVVDYGNRLVIHIQVPHPAASYIDLLYNTTGHADTEPKQPEAFGISHFNDITEDNYAKLCAYYKILDIQLPPPKQLAISETCSSNGIRTVSLPNGYSAGSATITYAAVSSSYASVQVILGNTSTSFTASGSQTVNLAGSSGQLPFGAIGQEQLLTPPATDVSFLVAVEISCSCTDEELNRWKMKLYARIMEAYQRLRREYDDSFQPPVPFSSNPLQTRQVIYSQLKQQCLQLLLDNNPPPSGNLLPVVSGAVPPPEPLDEDRFAQFLDGAFEWNELSYSLSEYDRAPGALQRRKINVSDTDPLLPAFLQATSASVFIPVRPGFDHQLLFYLWFGMTWTGHESLTPILPAQLSIVNELKKIREDGYRERHPKVLDTWETVMPTSLQVLHRSIHINSREQEPV